MCNTDRKTGARTSDCGKCSCSMSDEGGNHNPKTTDGVHLIVNGKPVVTAAIKTCTKCGDYCT